MTPPDPNDECDELRVGIERLRTFLETLVVRGLRACGADELGQLRGHAEHLEKAGAGHVAGALSELHALIERDDRGAARSLLRAQASVRLLERLLTLRVVGGQYALALAAEEGEGRDEAAADDRVDDDESEDE
jgi:hypothetical protein